MSIRASVCGVLAAAGFAAAVAAQVTYEQSGARIQFQVWDQSANGGAGAWDSSLVGLPGMRVEWRMVLSYTGTRTDLFALGEVLYQPVVTNVDNVDGGNGVDVLAPWRNGGVSGNGIAGSMITEAEGNNGGSLGTYGRVRFGGTVMAATSSSTLTTFRHTSGSDGAPPGDFMRVAGSFVSQWPRSLAGPVPPLDVTTDDLNRTLRGVSSMQQSQALSPTFHVPGTTGIVLFRGAITLSGDPSFRNGGPMITTFRESLRRVGGATGAEEGDDRRFITWQTGPSDSGSHRTLEPVIVPAHIQIFIPAPGAWCGLALVPMLRRRRRV